MRIVNARGVNLNVFDFDYDLPWAAFFLNADEVIYGRFGGRDAESPDKYLTRAALRYAMEQALARHRRQPALPLPSKTALPRTVDQYPAARRVKETACIHCHQVYDFEREQMRAKGTWHKEEVWVYPLPENLGFSVAVEQGNRVAAVVPHSAAAQAGLRAGDTLLQVAGFAVASFADVQYALHRAPAKGQLGVTFVRKGAEQAAELMLDEGWRRTDLSWRASTKRLGPPPSVRGEDLTGDEKRALGLTPRSLAFRQGNFVSTVARQAGIRQNDIIVGIDGKALEMTVGQFLVYIRLNYQGGAQITYNIWRVGKRLDIPLTLPQP